MHGPSPLRHHLETALEPGEQQRIGRRLSLLLAAAALLLVGLGHRALFPGDGEVAALLLGLGALAASAPVLAAGFRGFVARDTGRTLEQLVSLALLACLAAGEFVTAILVPLLMSIGHFLEERSIRGARAAIEGLKRLRPSRATRLGPEGECEVDAEALGVGDVVVVRPGDVIPADGVVIHGVSAVDQSSMTGESAAEEVAHGSQVFAGTVNLSGLLRVKVTGVAGATALGRILELLHQAERSEAPIMRVIERYARVYLPAVLVLAAAVLVVTHELSRAVTILVVSCPCALVLASPAAMTAALAVAARLGVLIKSSRFLEALGDVDTLLVDKTGTVTMGQLEVVAVHALEGREERDVLAVGAACAFGSRHPVSRAVGRAAEDVDFAEPASVEEVHGRGMVGRQGGEVLRLGSGRWLEEEGIELSVEAPPHHGPTVWVARDRTVLGYLLLADRPRPGSREALARVRELGVGRMVLMTGDRRAVAEAVAAEFGFDEVLAECLPERKSAVVEAERAAGRTVMMVGDGVNDALALSRADVGIAMGAMGSAVAVESADIALMSNDLNRLAEMIRLSRLTRLNIHQNVFIAVASSLGMMALASAGAIVPAVGAAVHNAGTFLVLANAARILRFPRR
ncbi:MAG: cadmium-translocating P-type ATPase [Planctomycetes bacterium]|nr:cadmium-translocating P-type ATPase [Planctomycetota bacterium]